MIPLQVLITEDSEADAELLLQDSRRGGYAPAYERVETPDGLSDALARQFWDLIISTTPCRVSTVASAKLVQEKGYDIRLSSSPDRSARMSRSRR